ncbi:MAG: tRNA pseudouridine(38-40) synthase TruA [Oscillospiraceae bacterium]|nr:tRNA pseudouridine(38-40) synthase TruA [Oscillospiraceae bacterium]
MKNLKFIIAFNGMKYHGFQRQPKERTIQGQLETAFKKIVDENVKITGCSRTDAGVHARNFCFNTFTKSRIPEENLVRALNSMLPSDIAVLSCEQAEQSFNARFSAKGKEYVYLINNKNNRDVFLQGLCLHYPHEINLEKMKEAAKLFIGEHDFAAFCKSENKKHELGKHGTMREIFSFEVEEKDGFVELIVRGNGFLYNMVRILAGTLIYVSEGKRTQEDITDAFKTGDRNRAGKTLPPCGLYLNKVFY